MRLAPPIVSNRTDAAPRPLLVGCDFENLKSTYSRAGLLVVPWRGTTWIIGWMRLRAQATCALRLTVGRGHNADKPRRKRASNRTDAAPQLLQAGWLALTRAAPGNCRREHSA